MKRAKLIKGYKPKANDNFDQYEDELTLAELIQNAAARGLHSVRGALFAKPANEGEDDADIEADDGTRLTIIEAKNLSEEVVIQKKGGLRKNPPKGTTCACAIGAMALTPKLSNPLNVTQRLMAGNDAVDDHTVGGEVEWGVVYDYNDERSMQIGLAYEQALRPE